MSLDVPLAEIVRIVKEADILPRIDELDPEKTFSEQGVDSLDQALILLLVERALEVKLIENRPESLLDLQRLLASRPS